MNPAQRHRMVMLVGLGLGIAGVLLYAASRVDTKADSETTHRRIPARDLVDPTPLTAEERRNSGSRLEDTRIVELENGAWVQVVDESGRLSQEYSAARVEPLPDRWMRLESPQAIFYRADGRVFTLTADRGEARVPNRAMEKGKLAGNVRIRMFRPLDAKPVDVKNDTEVLLVNASDATFDNVLGEIRCDGDVDLASEAGSFAGRGLSLFVDSKGGLERLLVDECTKPIVLVRGADGKTRAGDAAPQPNSAPSVARGATPSAAAPAPAKAKEPARPYRLTLSDDVHVTREKDGRVSRLVGDRLVALFTLESSSLEDMAPNGDNRAARAKSPPPTAPAAPVAPAGAASKAQPASEEKVTIEYDGPLLLEAAPDVELSSEDDVRVELVSDQHPVTLDDEETKAHVECTRLSFRGGEDTVEAFGGAAPLTVTSPRLKASGQRFFLERGSGKGGFIGPGTVELASGAEAFAALALDSSAMIAVSDQKTGELEGAIVIPKAARTEPRSVAIRWSERLDLGFVPFGGADDGALQGAHFVGAVHAEGQNFALDADSLDARFAQSDGSKRGQRLEQLVAEGSETKPAVAQRLDDHAQLSARRLDLTLKPGAHDDALPSRLVATDDVSAIRGSETVYGDTLVTVFIDADTPRAPHEKREPEKELAADISVVTLDGDVQAEIRSPGADSEAPVRTRVFADRLAGDGIGRTLDVIGQDVWVVRETVVADRLRSIHFDEATRLATSTGPGRVRTFVQPIEVAEGRAPRPKLDGQVRLNAEWRDGFEFDEKGSDGNGSIDLTGTVRVRNTPDRRSTDTLESEKLRLDLAPRDSSAAAKSDGSTDALLSQERASVRRIDARDQVVLQSTSWTNAERQGDPRLFKLKGDHIIYDTLTREGTVDGAGELLTHVPEKTSDSFAERSASSESPTTEPIATITPVPLAAEGSSTFTWKRRLDMKSLGDDRFRIDMSDGVSLGHADKSNVLVLNAARLSATVVRAKGTDPAEPSGIDLGGTARVERIEAFGDGANRVIVRTTDFTLQCDSIDYSVLDRVAHLAAKDGASVNVTQRDGGNVVKAEAVRWDLANGLLHIEGARGKIGR